MQHNQDQGSGKLQAVFMLKLLKSENVTVRPVLVNMQNSAFYYKIKIESKAWFKTKYDI